MSGSKLQPVVGQRLFFIPDERESTLEPGYVWVLRYNPWAGSYKVAYVADDDVWFWCHAAELSTP